MNAVTDRLDLRDPRLIRALLPLMHAVNRHYLRLRVEGLENLPKGPALLVANHNGGIAGPDLICTMATLWEALGPDAPLYALAHDAAMRAIGPLGLPLRKLGCLRASPENAEHVLAAGGKLLVYPGGDIEAYRTFKERNRIILGNRSGFVRVAQRTDAPIVPIVVHGAHRSAYIVHDGAWVASKLNLQKWARVSRFPLALALPYGLAIGPFLPYLPLPFSIRLRVLGELCPNARDDPDHVRECVRARMQTALGELAKEHACSSIWRTVDDLRTRYTAMARRS